MPVRARLRQIYYKVKLLVHRSNARLQPDDSSVQLKIVEAHIQREEWSSALQRVQPVIQTEPENAFAHRLLGQAQQGLGQTTAALESIRTSLRLDGTSPWAHQALGQIYMDQQAWPEAIAAFQAAVDQDGQNSWLQFSLGEALVKSSDWQAAVNALTTSSQLNPVFPWAYYYLADAKLALGDIAAAKSLYQKAQLLGPDIEHFRGNLAYVEHLQQQDQQIQAYLDRCQKSDSPRPRVLLITPGPTYPPKLGVTQRMFHEMQALHEQTDLVVASLLYAKNDFGVKEDLRNYCQLSVLVEWSDRPACVPDTSKTVHRYTSQQFHRSLKQLAAANFDIVVTDFVYMGHYRELFPDAFHVLAEHNIESQILRRSADVQQQRQGDREQGATIELAQEADRLAAFEDQTWPQFPLKFVVSEQDQKQLMARCDVGETWVVNNGSNVQGTEMFPDNPNPRILFIGTLNYTPNVDGVTYFVKQVMPHVWRLNPEIELWVAGANPVMEVQQIARCDRRIRLVANPEVMEDVAKQCCLSVVPLRIGSGTRIKILQSLAMGLPTVATSLGCEGIPVVDDQHLLIRDQPEDFAQAVVGLISDVEWRDRLRQTGRQLVEEQYDWSRIFAAAVQRLLRHTGWTKTQ